MAIGEDILEKARNSDLNKNEESKESIKQKLNSKIDEYEERAKELEREDLLTDVDAIRKEIDAENYGKALIMIHGLEDLS